MNTAMPINSLEDLNRELRRLRQQKRLYASLLKSDMDNVKQLLAPHKLLGYVLSDITRNMGSNQLLSKGIALASGFLIDKVLFRKAGFLKRFFIKQAASTTLDQAVQGKKGLVGKLVSAIFNRN